MELWNLCSSFELFIFNNLNGYHLQFNAIQFKIAMFRCLIFESCTSLVSCKIVKLWWELDENQPTEFCCDINWHQSYEVDQIKLVHRNNLELSYRFAKITFIPYLFLTDFKSIWKVFQWISVHFHSNTINTIIRYFI